MSKTLFSNKKHKAYTLTTVFVVGCLLLIAVIAITHSNRSLFYHINALHVYLPNYVWLAVNAVVYPRFFVLAVVLLVLTWWKRRECLWNVILVIAAYYCLFQGFKLWIFEARPHMTLDHHTFFWLNHFENAVKSAYNSFPSGHVGNMAVFIFSLNTLFFQKNWPMQCVLLLALVFVMLARICTGWHWPIDVLASAAIGALLVRLCFIRSAL